MALWCVVALLGFANTLALFTTNADRRPVRRVLMLFAVLAGLLATATLTYLFAPAPVGTKSLRGSLERETGSAGFTGECKRSAGADWRCDVADRQGSGTASYTVEVDGRCWRARRSSPDHYSEGPMPARAAGCTRLRDAISLLD